MTTGLVKYEPLLEIRTYKGDKYYIPWATKEAFENSMKQKKFISYWDWGIATASIEWWGKPSQNDNIIENFLKWREEKISRIVREKAKEYLLNFSTKEMTIWILQQILEKYE